MKALTAEDLVSACSDQADDGGVTIRSLLEPIAGEGAPVKPATYAGGMFQHGKRWWGEAPDRKPVDVLVIDNEPSQANRLEAALLGMRATLGLPDIVLDLSGLGSLPPHLPQAISIFQFPHRSADAYLRDSLLDGQPFLKTAIGKAIFDATGDRPAALLEWCPQALLYGFWQSHLGRKRSQAKLARAWTSEIVGYEPAAADVRRQGLKGDPLNLSITEAVEFDDANVETWTIATKGKKLADVGHGQVPFGGDDAALAGVSFRTIMQQSTVSFASLRRVRAGTASAEARALLASLGLVAHVAAFGRPFSLRSGADLRPATSTWTWVGSSHAEQIQTPDATAAIEVFQDCVKRAAGAALPVGSGWATEPLILTPAPNLGEAIGKSWPTDA